MIEMMTKSEFDLWCVRNNISETTKAVVTRVREGEPVRKARSKLRNVSGTYPSKKMGKTIQFESHTLELRAIYEFEHDPDVLEFYDQSLFLKMNYWVKNGRAIGNRHVPDYFVIRKSSAGVEECKPVTDLEGKSQEYLGLYEQEEQGQWISPAGNKAAADLGLYYRIKDDSDPDGCKTILYRNLQFLEDYLLDTKGGLPLGVKEAVVEVVRVNPSIVLLELIGKCSDIGIEADSIYRLVVQEEIYIDLELYVLAEPHYACVYFNKELYQSFISHAHSPVSAVQHKISRLDVKAGTKFVWEGVDWTFLNIGEQHLFVVSQNGQIAELPFGLFEKLVQEQRIKGITLPSQECLQEEVRKLLEQANEGDYEIANYRLSQLQRHWAGQSVETPSRTIRDWNQRYKEAEINLGRGYLGLLPKHKERGNRTPRLPLAVTTLMKEHIDSDYLTIKQKRIAMSYGKFSNLCESKGYLPPSYKVYAKAIREIEEQEKRRRREGKKVAYQFETPYLYLEYSTPRHGDRVFQIGHIDHTELDIVLRDSRTGKVIGKPWVTFLTDAFNRRILSFYLTFDPPSYRSCMMVIRECVRQHSRLPDCIVVDGGKEFHSIYFDTLLAMYEITKKVRPPGKARFGSVCERLFGKTTTQVLSGLLGNTKPTKKVRTMTKETDPNRNAVWTLQEFNRLLGEYVYEVNDQLHHPVLGMTPREAHEQSILLSGKREMRLIPYNEDFLILTLPSTKKGTAMVHSVNGVKINNLYYNNTELKNAKLARKQVPVRYDPYDIGVAYVYVNSRWIRCISQYYSVFKGRTERELKFVTEEMKIRYQQNSKHFTTNARQIALFIQKAESKEKILKQQWKDMELKDTIKDAYYQEYSLEDNDWSDEDEEWEEVNESTNQFEGYGEL